MQHEFAIMSENSFVNAVINIGAAMGYRLEIARDGSRQIDFGHKKLKERHLRALYPKILYCDHIPTLIERIAPGRPCVHRPMRLIIRELLGKDGEEHGRIRGSWTA